MRWASSFNRVGDWHRALIVTLNAEALNPDGVEGDIVKFKDGYFREQVTLGGASKA